MSKADRASELFSNNFNCSQAVLTAFAADFGIDEELALKLGTQFGGGARNGEMCGAVSGALMVLGLKYGHYQADNIEQKSRAYSIASEYTRRFKDKNGSIVCRELLGLQEKKSAPVPEERTKEYYKKRPCSELVHCAAAIAEKYLEENK